METIVFFAQAIIAFLLVVAILLQQRGSALGSSFGQEGDFFAERRGAQKQLYFATIILGTLFILLAIFNLVSPNLG
jgi:protein translocase SecG subunit